MYVLLIPFAANSDLQNLLKFTNVSEWIVKRMLKPDRNDKIQKPLFYTPQEQQCNKTA